jgi:hypothetical protein
MRLCGPILDPSISMKPRKAQRVEVLSVKDRIRHHEFLLRLYHHSIAYADLLRHAGNLDGSKSIMDDCQTVAREHMLDRVLNPAKPA